MVSSLTVYLEGSFWVAVAETEIDGRYAVARVILGAEPTGAEMRVWALEEYRRLEFRARSDDRGSEGPSSEGRPGRERNPKRAAREAAAARAQRGLSTRAQEAVQSMLEERKQERRALTRAERDAAEERRWALRVQRRKEKKRGR